MEFEWRDRVERVGGIARRFLRQAAIQVALSAAVVTGLHFTTVNGLPFDVWLFGPSPAMAVNAPALVAALAATPPPAAAAAASLPEAAAASVAASLPEAVTPRVETPPVRDTPVSVIPVPTAKPKAPVEPVRDAAAEQAAPKPAPAGKKPEAAEARTVSKADADAAAPAAKARPKLAVERRPDPKDTAKQASARRPAPKPVARQARPPRPPVGVRGDRDEGLSEDGFYDVDPEWDAEPIVRNGRRYLRAPDRGRPDGFVRRGEAFEADEAELYDPRYGDAEFLR